MISKNKLFAAFLAAVFIFICSACSNGGQQQSQSDNMNDNYENIIDYKSILNDKKFKNGMMVRGLGDPIYGDPVETFGHKTDPRVPFTYGKEGLNPVWNLCQWSTRYPFHDIENTTDSFNYRFTDEGEGKYLYENRSKTVEVDTAIGEVRLALDANVCYKQPRRQGESWPHLLFEQYLFQGRKAGREAHISELSSVRVKCDVKINSFVDYMGDSANPGLHSAMFIMYLFVSNYDPSTMTATDMLWFGLPIFDNRHMFSSAASFPDVGTKESATNKWIYNIASSDFFTPDNNLYNDKGEIIFDEWKSVDVELLTQIKRAFTEAQAAGYMKNSKWENLYIDGTYFGFELPGTYKIDMSIKNYDILTYRETK